MVAALISMVYLLSMCSLGTPLATHRFVQSLRVKKLGALSVVYPRKELYGLPISDKNGVSAAPLKGQVNDDYVARFSNIARLYGPDTMSIMERLSTSSVAVIGLGGVGSWVVEALARSGIGNMTLIDFDDICISNVNRQLPAMSSTVGKFKAEVLKERVLDINPSARVEVVIDFVRPENVDSLLITSTTGKKKFDFVVDAADGVSDKAAIIDACVRSATPVVVSGGVGGLVDPTLIRTSDLAYVTGDNLLMRVRKRLRQKSGYPKGEQMSGGRRNKMKKWGVRCVHTLPTGSKRGASNDEGSASKCDTFGNSCFSTGTAGFVMASEVVNGIMDSASSAPSSLLPGAPSTTSTTTAASSPLSTSLLSSSGENVSRVQAETGGDTTVEGFDWEAGESEDGLQGTSLFDAHCHLQLDPLYERHEEVIRNAIARGVGHASVCSVRPGEDWERVRNLHQAFPGFVRPQFGLHPWWLKRYADEQVRLFESTEQCIDCEGSPSFDPFASLRTELTSILTANPAAGVGECGLDKGVSRDVPMQVQKAVMALHVEIAAEMNRPITFHCVGAWGALLEVLEAQSHTGHLPPAIVLHSCNSMSGEMLTPFMRLQAPVYFSFVAGRSTTNQKTISLLKACPLGRIMVETDSPDALLPELRSQLPSNEMATLRRSIRALAAIKEVEPRELAEAATNNAQSVFLFN